VTIRAAAGLAACGVLAVGLTSAAAPATAVEDGLTCNGKAVTILAGVVDRLVRHVRHRG